MATVLDRADMIGGFRDLVAELRTAGEVARIRLVGGAALALRYFDRGTTQDLDSLHTALPVSRSRQRFSCSLSVSPSAFNCSSDSMTDTPTPVPTTTAGALSARMRLSGQHPLPGVAGG
ncbi:hypothetical protein [Microbacterium lacticum]